MKAVPSKGGSFFCFGERRKAILPALFDPLNYCQPFCVFIVPRLIFLINNLAH